jgi:hypothetical protein
MLWFNKVLLKGDGANPRRFAILTRDVTDIASTSHITFNFSLKVIFFRFVSTSKIVKFNYLQAVHE